MLTSFVSESINLSVPFVAAAKAGDIRFVGKLCCQVTNDVAADSLGTVRREGVIRVPKITTDVYALGADVHWNTAASLAQTAPADGRMGTAVGLGAAGDNWVEVCLNS